VRVFARLRFLATRRWSRRLDPRIADFKIRTISQPGGDAIALVGTVNNKLAAGISTSSRTKALQAPNLPIRTEETPEKHSGQASVSLVN
jgi:hypothetical protein